MTWWTRRRLIAVGVVAAVAAAGGVYLVVDALGRDQIEGPHGAYPEAVGDESPADVSQVLTVANAPVIVDGLRIEAIDFDDGSGVAAYDMRTGEGYWTWRHGDRDPSRLTSADGLLYVLWDDGTLAQFDPEVAETRWAAETEPNDSPAYLRVVGEEIAVIEESEVTAFGLDDGAEVWSATLDEDCFLGQLLAVGESLAVKEKCPSQSHVTLFGPGGETTVIDTGATDRIIRVGDGRFGVTALYEDLRVFSAETGEETAAVPLPDEPVSYYRDGDGQVLVAENLDAFDDGEVVYAAWDLAADEPSWTVAVDGTWRAEDWPWLRDGRLYTLRAVNGEPNLHELVVYDAATGEELSSAEIDLDDYLVLSDYDGESFSYRDNVGLRIDGIHAGTITVTITDLFPGTGTSGYCEQCSIIFAAP